VDTYQGHGTRVAGIIAGKLASNVEDKADGVAPDAKLHMWDIQKGTGESN
jgi:subtilisin family serine protease